MPSIGMFLVILAGMFLTGGIALYIARNVEHGEARFGPDGKQLPTTPPREEKNDMRVTITRDGTNDE